MTGIERLRKLSEDMLSLGLWLRLTKGTEKDWDCYQGDGRTVNDELLSIADQIEREQEALVREAEDVSGRDGDALAWVEEHGGLEAMVELSSRLMTVDALRAAIEETCTRIGVERTGDLTQDAQAIWREIGALRSRLKESVPRAAYERHLARRQRQIDESHAALRRRNARIEFLVSELNRANHENHEEFMRHAGDFTAFTDEVCKRLATELRYVEGCSKDVMDAALEALDRRLMPEGMERLVDAWPRFGDGEPVRFLDDFERYGEKNGVSAVTMYSDGSFALNFRAYSKGESVKRPTPKDSWERLEEDANKNPFDYCKDVGHRLDTCENSEAYKARDLVRRCRALAERGER